MPFKAEFLLAWGAGWLASARMSIGDSPGLAVERNKTINDLIEELLNNYEGSVGGDSIVEGLNEVKAMLRDCLDRLGVRQLAENKPVEIKSSQAETGAESRSEVGGDSLFGDNPWVQILRVRYGSQDL